MRGNHNRFLYTKLFLLVGDRYHGHTSIVDTLHVTCITEAYVHVTTNQPSIY